MEETACILHDRVFENANVSADMAIAKAVHAMHFRRPTRLYEELLDKGNMAVLEVPGMVPVEGELPLHVGEQVVGAIGVSGARSSQDGIFTQVGEQALQVYLSEH